MPCKGGSGHGLWSWLFFVGLGLGLLAKGPIAVVLVSIAFLLWVAWQRAWRITWLRLPWLRGILVVALIALPWYLWAEHRTPGFLRYFLVGEHWQRYTQSGWSGDLYGVGHARPLGTIWLYGLAAATPWAVLLPLAFLFNKKTPAARGLRAEPATALLVCWMLSPLLFFTFARNILPAYVLPALPAFALLTAHWIQAGSARRPVAYAWCAALLVPLAAFGLVYFANEHLERRSQRELLQRWDGQQPLVYLFERPNSAVFYSQGQALEARDIEDIKRWLAAEQPAILIIREERMSQLLNELGSWSVIAKHGRYVMLRTKPR